MLRFPNPGSTIGNFIAVYRAAFKEYRGSIVTLDDIVSAVVKANLATSSGYMGDEAIARSTRTDRSRDSLYNQLKMYAEIFRSMGWLHPTEERSLNYTFTLLGEQLVAAESHWLALFQECVLGIVYPTRILEIKGEYRQRPFVFILRAMRRLQNVISRDEMILGPLSANSDIASSDIESVVNKIILLRRSPNHIKSALQSLSLERKIQINTLRNYTRWPIAVLRDSGWTENIKVKFDDGSVYSALKLSASGLALAEAIESCSDIRLQHLDRLSRDQKKAICIQAHYSMLERSGFDLTPVRQILAEQELNLSLALKHLGVAPQNRLLCSPFQTLSMLLTPGRIRI